MTEPVVVDIKAFLDPMTRSVLDYPNRYGLVSLAFWATSFACMVAVKMTGELWWFAAAGIAGLFGMAVLGIMFIAVRRAKRLIAAVSAPPIAAGSAESEGSSQ